MSGKQEEGTSLSTLPAYFLGQAIAAVHGHGGESDLARWAALLSAHLLEGRVYLAINAPLAGLDVKDRDMVIPSVVPEWMEVVSEKQPASGKKPIVKAGDTLWLARYYQFNHALRAQIATRRSQLIVSIDEKLLEEDLKVLFPDARRTAEDLGQLLAAANLIDLAFGLLTGGPGTGKTTSLAKLLMLWLRQKSDGPVAPILLCAPTGKAAARLRQSLVSAVLKLRGILGGNPGFAPLLDLLDPESPRCLVKTQTIHSALGVRSSRREGQGPFWRGKDNPLEVSMVIVDEVSMVDLALMTRLMDAVPLTVPLFFVGDIDQLESVEAGSVLLDVTTEKRAVSAERLHLTCARAGVTAEQVPGDNLRCQDHVHLTSVHRYKEGSLIGKLAKAINEGRSDDFIAMIRADDAAAKGVVWIALPAAGRNLPAGNSVRDFLMGPDGYGPLADLLKSEDILVPSAAVGAFDKFRVLCAVRKGPDGVERWNERLQQWAVGTAEKGSPRAVMITTNDQVSGFCNGDTGLLLPEGEMLRFHASDGRQTLAAQLPASEPGWAITIHKSQGSEYNTVAIVLPRSGGDRLIKQRLLYTALTRAAEKVIILATETSLRDAITRR